MLRVSLYLDLSREVIMELNVLCVYVISNDRFGIVVYSGNSRERAACYFEGASVEENARVVGTG